MADRLCRECQDMGNCRMCSPDFEKTKIHGECGKTWQEHKRDARGWAQCPKVVALLPEPTICDMNCFLEPNHFGPHQFDAGRANWMRRVQEGKLCGACGEWPEFCGCETVVPLIVKGSKEDMEKIKLASGKTIEIPEEHPIKVYQCGPMAGCTDEEMHGWRDALKKDFPQVTWLDPCDREYKQQQWRRLVEDDIADIDSADYILAYYWKTGTGSAMELSYNYHVAKKPAIVVVPGFKQVSPWLRYHADYLVDNFDHALKIILNKDEGKF